MASNTLIVVQGHDHPVLLKDSLKAMDLNWISGAPPHTQWVYAAKTRYRQADAPCSIAHVDDTCCEVISLRRNGRSRQANPWCSMKVRYAWAAV